MISELGGAAVHGGLQTRGLPGNLGRLTPEQVRGAVRALDPLHTPSASILALEDTHNSSGGTVWPYEDLAATVATGRELGLAVHLDGARLANAAVASGRPAEQIGGLFDTVTLCFSKGLGAPLGAVIAGSHELMARARVEKHRFGGAMRQAGIVAASALFALEHNVERLAEDHERAQRLALGWTAAGLPVELARVHTNFVQVDVGALGLNSQDALERIARDAGVLLSPTVRADVLRAVTHLDISDDDIEVAITRVPAALGAPHAIGA